MEWSRVKNILIILLLLVNGFLFAAYMNAELSQRKDEAETRNNVYQILTRLGIEIDPELIPSDSEVLYPARIERDINKEQTIAETILGELNKTELGGGKITYSSSIGTLGFRNGGFFDIDIKTSNVKDAEHARKIALKTLKPFNISTDSSLVTVVETPDGYEITFPQLYSKYKVFNCLNTVRINFDGSLSISGRRAADTIVFARGFHPRGISGLFLDLADNISELGTPIKKITEVESGFMVETVSGTGMNLITVWRIKANGVDYYISALDGKLLSIN